MTPTKCQHCHRITGDPVVIEPSCSQRGWHAVSVVFPAGGPEGQRVVAVVENAEAAKGVAETLRRWVDAWVAG